MKLRKVAEKLLLARLRQHALDAVQKEGVEKQVAYTDAADQVFRISLDGCSPSLSGLSKFHV